MNTLVRKEKSTVSDQEKKETGETLSGGKSGSYINILHPDTAGTMY